MLKQIVIAYLLNLKNSNGLFEKARLKSRTDAMMQQKTVTGFLKLQFKTRLVNICL